MKLAYPIIIEPKVEGEDYYTVNIPDLDKMTQGETLVECIEMARDLIGIVCLSLLDKGKELPCPNTIDYDVQPNDIKTLVDIDLDEYRKKEERKTVRKNVCIPYYLNERAEKLGINFSRLLTTALEEKIGY